MSENKLVSTNRALLFGLFVFLLISYGFDRISDLIGKYVTTHDIKSLPFGMVIPFIYPTATLMIGTVAFSTYWLMQNRLSPQKWVKIFYMVIGLIVATAYSLSRMFKSPDAVPDLLEQAFWPLSYLHIAGSLVAVIGFLLVILPKNENKKQAKTWLFDLSLFMGLLAFFYICYNLDTAIFRITAYFARYKILFWFYPVALLFVETVVMVLFWYIQNTLSFQKLRTILFLTVGLLITYAYDFLGIEIIQGLFPPHVLNSQIPTVIVLQDIFWPNYYLHIAGVLVATTGLLLLFLPKKEITQKLFAMV